MCYYCLLIGYVRQCMSMVHGRNRREGEGRGGEGEGVGEGEGARLPCDSDELAA